MSLRKLTLLLVTLTTIGLVVVVLINITQILENHFKQQEKNNVYLNILRVNSAIDQQFDFLANASNDWASRNDTYRLIETSDPQFIDENLEITTFQNLKANLFILLNPDLEIVYSKLIDKSGQPASNIPAEITAQLQPGSNLLTLPPGASANQGLISINNQPMMIIAHPVIKNDGSGLTQGILLLGKYIDSAMLNTINNLLSLSVEIYPVGASLNSQEFENALAYTATDKDPWYVELTPNAVYGYVPLKDINHQASFIMRLNRFPALYNNGILVNNYLVISVVMISITFSALLFFLIEFNVLNRVRHLSNEVQAIGVSGDKNKRLQVKRKDEISYLAVKINEMLGALERANQERLESEERFRTLVESMEDVVFTADRDSQKVHFYEKKSAPEAAAQSEQTAIPAVTLQADLENELVKQQAVVNRSFHGENAVMEWSTGNHHEARNFITTLSPIYNAHKEITSVVGVSKDITHQKKLEQDLRNRVNELGALFNVSQQLLSEIEEETIFEIICRLAVEQIGMDAAWIGVLASDETMLKPIASYGLQLESLNEIALSAQAGGHLHPAAAAIRQQELVLFSYENANQDGQAASSEPNSAAAIPIIQAGATLALLVLIKREEPHLQKESLPLIHAYVNLASVAMQNAYLFKQVLKGRERLQSISRRLVAVQEEERRQIALELHDEIGQILTGLRLSMDMFDTLPAEKIKDQNHLSVEIIKDLIERVRQMSLNLRPSMLDDLGIVPTLLWYLDRYTSQTGIQVNFKHNNLIDRRYSSDIEITVFRVIQEALTNVARYADVQSANVRLWSTERIIGLQIEDEGVGFDQEQVFNSHDTKGLLGMRERVGFLQGQLQIITQPGEGTCLTVEIPLSGFLERRKRDRTGSAGR